MDWLIHIITVTEILGTVAFAISGAMVAVKKRMDILGVIVLGVITAVGGGVIRDLLLGITPPTAFQNPVYVAWAFVTSIIVFVMVGLRWDEKSRKRFDMWLNMADALRDLGFLRLWVCARQSVADMRTMRFFLFL